MPRHMFASLLSMLALVVALPVTSAADESPDDSDDDEAYQEMLDLSNAAADAVAADNFEIGAVKFRQAYDSYADPVLLNNEMIAWYRADDCRNALVPARAYLEQYDQEGDDVSPDDRRNIETVMIDCHLELAEEALDDDNAVLANYHLDMLSDAEPEDDDRQRYDNLREDLEQQADDQPVATAASTSPDTSSGWSDTHLGWTQIAGGIAAAGIGLSMHTVALSRQSHLRDLSEDDPDRFETLQDDWSGYQNTARWVVPSLYLVGAAAIGSGTYFLLRDSEDDDLTVSPTVAPGETGLSLEGRF